KIEVGTAPEQPVDPTVPTKPTDPTKPMDPTKPTVPTDPTKPIDQAGPTDPAQPLPPGTSGEQGAASTGLANTGGGTAFPWLAGAVATALAAVGGLLVWRRRKA